MPHYEQAKKIAAFTSRFVPLNIVQDVVEAIYDAGMYIITPRPDSATEIHIPTDCTDAVCRELSTRLPGDCNRCTNRKETP